MPVLTAEERLGQVLNDKYRVDRVLGQGGMGVVFAAEHTWTGRPVAVKMLHPELAREQPLVQRFFREARAAASLKHPNVIDVLDMGSTPDGAVYLVLEFLEGEPLSARLEREGRLEPAEAAALLLPVMDALERAHQGGIVHRDLKPDNVFCTRVDVPGAVRSKLLDFGIAKDNAEQRVTATGHAMGTPAYMPPEQLSSAAHVTASADVWSMGVIWYEVLSGALPFEGESLPLLTVAIMTTKPRPLCARVPALPEALGAAVDRALERSTSQRWASMGDFADALRAALGLPAVARPPAPPSRDPDASAKRTVLALEGPAPLSGTAPTLGPAALGTSSGTTAVTRVGVRRAPARTPTEPAGVPPPRRASPLLLVGLGALVLGALGLASRGLHHEPAPSSEPARRVALPALTPEAPSPAPAPLPVPPPPAPVVPLPAAPAVTAAAPAPAPPLQRAAQRVAPRPAPSNAATGAPPARPAPPAPAGAADPQGARPPVVINRF